MHASLMHASGTTRAADKSNILAVRRGNTHQSNYLNSAPSWVALAPYG